MAWLESQHKDPSKLMLRAYGAWAESLSATRDNGLRESVEKRGGGGLVRTTTSSKHVGGFVMKMSIITDAS